MKNGTRITQHKGRRNPIQLQDQVDSEITNLLDQALRYTCRYELAGSC